MKRLTDRLSNSWQLPILFLLGRLILILTLPLEGLKGYGDTIHFFRLAGMGWPYFDYWIEFPPVFSFLSSFLFHLSAGRQHVYDYLFVFIVSLFQAGCLYLFVRIANIFYDKETIRWRGNFYLATMIGLGYGWWFFDAIALLFMLLGLYWILTRRDLHAGVALALGVLTKLFPALALISAWLFLPRKYAIRMTLITIGLTGIVYTALLSASPEMTWASLRSQANKGSWETIWALLDGNYQTGNFGPEAERVDARTAIVSRGNPPRLPAWITILPFGAGGLWLLLRSKPDIHVGAVGILGLAWCLFLLWSPGWSPQWVMYLVPLILLALPEREAFLMVVTLILINLLEWPVLLSRGFTWGLWLTIPVRTALLALLSIEFWKYTPKLEKSPVLEKGLS